MDQATAPARLSGSRRAAKLTPKYSCVRRLSVDGGRALAPSRASVPIAAPHPTQWRSGPLAPRDEIPLQFSLPCEPGFGRNPLNLLIGRAFAPFLTFC